jgi:hypothetical protein
MSGSSKHSLSFMFTHQNPVCIPVLPSSCHVLCASHLTCFGHSNSCVFCFPCIIQCQYSATNMLHFLFSLLRIKGLYMFRALLAHPREMMHKRHLLYCMRVMSDGCTRISVLLRLLCSQLT